MMIYELFDYVALNHKSVVLLFVLVLFLFGIVFLLKFYSKLSNSIPILGMAATVTAAFKIKDIIDDYKLFVKNRAIINNSDNLTWYGKNKEKVPKKLRKFKVFKKNNFSINTFHWNSKNRYSSYFYTNSYDGDEEVQTLQRILKSTKISELRYKLVDYFFKHCLISFVANEDDKALNSLSKGEMVAIGDVQVGSQDYFTIHRQKCVENFNTNASPDLILCKAGDDTVIIDAYNGSSLKEVTKKINFYKSEFKTTRVFVFASGVANTMEQITSQAPPKFQFYEIKEEGENSSPPSLVEEIQIGSLVLNIKKLNETYSPEFFFYHSDIYYWQLCETCNKILKNEERSEELSEKLKND